MQVQTTIKLSLFIRLFLSFTEKKHFIQTGLIWRLEFLFLPKHYKELCYIFTIHIQNHVVLHTFVVGFQIVMILEEYVARQNLGCEFY